MSTTKPRSVPAHLHSVTPSVVVRDAPRAIEFYRHVLGASLLRRYDGPGGLVMHAELRIGDAVIMLCDELPELGLVAPEPARPVTSSIMLYCDDVDAVVARAVAAGATLVAPVADQFHGDRVGTVRDPFGHRWAIATHLEDVADDELQRRFAAWLADNTAAPAAPSGA